MLRHYYTTDDLDDLTLVEQELQAKGIHDSQFHVLSEQDAEVHRHQLHEVDSILKKDVVHSTEVGAAVGFVLASVTLLFVYAMDWVSSPAGWLPFIFLAIVILGFCTWEGGFIGIQTNNIHFRRFQRLLAQGKHVLFVDIDLSQQASLDSVVFNHPKLKARGTGEAAPGWLVHGRDTYHRFMKAMP